MSSPCPPPAAGAFEAVYRGVWIDASERARSFRMWVAADGPERVRLDIAGRLGGTWLSVALAEGELTAVSPRSGEHLRAKARPGLLAAVIGWPIEAVEVPGILLGCPPAGSSGVGALYEDWREEDGARVPGTVSVERAEGGTGGHLRFILESLRLGPSAAPLFSLEPPVGSRAVEPPAAGDPAPVWQFGEEGT
jgi:hypothetical protein